MKFVDFVNDNSLGKIVFDEEFKNLTTIGLGGKIRVLFYPLSIEKLCFAFRYIKENNLKYFVIGNGSNTLALDNTYDGIVISLKELKKSFIAKDNILTISANYPTIRLAYELSELNLGDLSFLGGIPGTIGGAIYNNSGAYNDSIKNHLIDVTYIDTSGNLVTLDNSKLMLGYRMSVFHKIEGIIVSARFCVKSVDTKAILLQRLNQRRKSQPLNEKSMGSIFKNSPIIPSYRIIDALNMRGFKINGIEVSNKHSNFIINANEGNSKDVLKIIEIIQKRAKLEFGINLEYEITLVN